MPRFFSHWFRPRRPDPIDTWQLTPDQHARLLELLSDIGLRIVAEARGPVPLLHFGRRLLDRLDTRAPLPQFADALKRIIRDMRHDRLRVMSPTDFLGVGYVYNAADPNTHPIRSSY
jgi:hypothetical protein